MHRYCLQGNKHCSKYHAKTRKKIYYKMRTVDSLSRGNSLYQPVMNTHKLMQAGMCWYGLAHWNPAPVQFSFNKSSTHLQKQHPCSRVMDQWLKNHLDHTKQSSYQCLRAWFRLKLTESHSNSLNRHGSCNSWQSRLFHHRPAPD